MSEQRFLRGRDLRWAGEVAVHHFIDEGGTFIPTAGWGVVCSLAIPHKEVSRARREIDWLSRDWPRKGGELKGGLLQTTHLESLVEVLFRHDALMHACAIDVSREVLDGVDLHKIRQCDGITKHLTPEHHPDLVQTVWDLRRVLERMSRQLYLQCVMMSQLVHTAAEEVAMYFAQRRPRELGKFQWTIDAKDPRRITTQEKWWRDTLCALLESRSRREPFRMVKGPSFNYDYFDRSFAMRHEMWFPDRPREVVEGHDIRKMMIERMGFVDSRSETLIQAVDILASFLRRLLAGKIAGDDVARALGRLQIRARRSGKHPQSLQLLTLSRRSSGRADLFKTLQVMTAAARGMIKPSRRLAA
jgi:hypothetical protein